MTCSPLVDVLLPAFNCADTIEELVRSICSQTVDDIRVLVIDDGSTDGTGEIAARLANHDRRISLIRKPNSGIVDALNLGLGEARAPFLARQDGDDISRPDRLERQLQAFERNQELVAVSGSCDHIDADGRLLGTRYAIWDPASADSRAIPSLEPYLLHPFLMMRRKALMAIGGYRHAFHAEDTDLYWRLGHVGRLLNLPDSLGRMRLHQTSVTNASIVNGRISAIHSQLAALSATRVADGRPDIEFPRDALASYKAARSLEGMLALAGVQLDAEERDYLRMAACAKLLELATARAYELDAQDCQTIRAVYRQLPANALRGRSIAGWAYRAALRRLTRTGQVDKLMALGSLTTIGRIALLRFRP